MAWVSTVPAALDALVALWRTSTDLDPDQILDGPAVSGSSLQEVVVVGFENEDTPAVVEGTIASAGLVTTPDREQYTITCAASVLRGNGDLADARRRAYELLAAAGGALAADHTLGGVVMSAQIGTQTLNQTRTSRGAVATVVFGVDCDAFTD